MDGYWNRVTAQRLSRRRSLQVLAASGVGAAALALIGCGGGGGSSSGGTNSNDASGLLSQKVDSTKQAVTGNTWQSLQNQDLVSLDPITNSQGAAQGELLWAYSSLVKHGFAVGKTQTPANINGDAAQSWELTPDATQITFKMRPGVKFDPRPPTNGRAANAADVKYSWDKAEKLSPFNTNVFNSTNPGAPVQSVSTPDDSTIVMKLAFPYAPMLELAAFYEHPLLVPVEAETGFNAKADMRGSGPYMLTSYQQGASMSYARNPNYYVQGRPFFDSVSKPIVPDYTTGLAQFESKATWDFNVADPDILRVKRDHREMVLLADPRPSGQVGIKILGLSRQPSSPLMDVRVRRAASMCLDRDLLLDALNNVSDFQNAGLPVTALWNSHLAAGYPDWVDPKSSDLGEGQAYFKLDVDNAKKMLQAAGMTLPVKLPWGYYTDRDPQTHAKLNETMANMIQETGLFQIDLNPLPYAGAWRTVCQQSRGDGFGGFCYNSADGFNEDAFLAANYTPDGKYAVSSTPLPETDLVLKARSEIDAQKRGDMIKQLQRVLATQMYAIPQPGVVLTFTLHWPWLQNYGVFETGGPTARTFTEAWYDASKKS